jgi:hypothetical protein
VANHSRKKKNENVISSWYYSVAIYILYGRDRNQS